MRRLLLVLILFLLGFVPLLSQEESYAFVLYAEGYDMTIFRNEELLTYDVLRDDVIGMPLLPGDLIQTDSETFVELQVMPSRTVIKVAENTTFRIEEIGGTGGGSFDLAYGRLRARVERVTGNERFQIRGRSAVAGVRGTDFGYDLVAAREGGVDAATQVYVFEGSVEVTETAEGEGAAEELTAPEEGNQGRGEQENPSGETSQSATIPSGGSGGPRTIILSANEMVSVIRQTVAATLEQQAEDAAVPARPQAQVVRFESRLIEQDIEQFWQERDFQQEPVNPEEVEDRFPEISQKVAQLTTERRSFLLAQKRSSLQEAPEPQRTPRELRLSVPAAEDRLLRSLRPEARADWSVSAERGGAVLTASGTVLGLAALGMAIAGDQVVSGYETGFDNPVTSAAVLSSGIFISGGLISLIASFFQ